MTNIYMETFNTYNRYEQELLFLNQKHAPLLYQHDHDDNQDWFNDFQAKLAEYNIDVDKRTLRGKGLIEILSQLSEDKCIDIINTFFRIEDKNRSEEEEENLNNIFLSGLLSDITRYKSIKQERAALLADEEKRAIIKRMEKIIRKDLIATLKTEKSLLESGEKVSYSGKQKKFSKSRVRGATGEQKTREDNNSRELHDNFTTSILTFHEIEKLYQKYKYIFTLRDLKDTHTILDSLSSGEMIMMTGDTGSGKTELSLLIASIYLDRIYGNSAEREDKKPILVTGNSDTDFSDLTIEKIITSKNIVSDQNDAIIGDDKEKTAAESVLDFINKESEVRKEVEEIIDKNEEYSPEEKRERKELLGKFKMLDYNIFTDFHLQGLVKAMANGVPLILDEINGISPEVLLGLNHYFTRKVGQTISIGNGFEPITIKKGFCIICTGNDKNENSKIMRYQGRYDIDESLLNRMYRVCKGYYRQDVSEEEYNNRNDVIESEEQEKTQIEYMNENELYGVILMLCFNKKSNNKNIDEISDESLLKKMINTETVGFDLIKESFKGQSFEKSKKQVFGELKSLAKFIHYVQETYQGHTILLGGKDSPKLKNSSFSMRQLVNIIQDWKTDTKSLWYHLYNDYVKQIPPENEDRYRIYRFAQESGFIDPDDHIENNPKDINRMTEYLEKKQNEEFHTSANTRNAQIKQTNIDEDILDSHLIITKQDMYKEYFGTQFGKVDDEDFKKQIEEERHEISEKEGIQEQTESIEDIKERIIASLDEISYFMSNGSNTYLDKLGFTITWELITLCKKEGDNYIYMDKRNETEFGPNIFNDVDKCLGAILEEFQKGAETGNIDSIKMSQLVEKLTEIGK